MFIPSMLVHIICSYYVHIQYHISMHGMMHSYLNMRLVFRIRTYLDWALLPHTNAKQWKTTKTIIKFYLCRWIYHCLYQHSQEEEIV